MQVLSALGMGIISVPTGSYRSEGLDVVLAGAGVEDEPVAKCLEECKIGIGLVGLLENILKLDLIFIGINNFLDAVVDAVNAE